MTNQTRLLGLAAVLGLMIGDPGRAKADFATYTESALSTGSINGVAFTNALATFTQTGDTANIVSFAGIIQLADVTSTFTIAGIGSGTFTGPTISFVTPGVAFAGLLNGV